jgi:3-oxoacyl-[acyl-carrier-protein] synthase II
MDRNNPARPRAVVLGFDLICPLGDGVAASWAAAKAGKSGIGPLTRFPLRDGFPVRLAGQVPPIDFSLYPFLSDRELSRWPSPVMSHGMIVVHRALKHAGIEITEEIAPRTATTFSTAVGGMDAILDADRKLVATGRLPKPMTNPNSCLNMVSAKASILTGARGPIFCPVGACATGSLSITTGALLLAAGMADVVIAGAVDFTLVEPLLAGFATMNGAYQEKESDRASRPFSVDRAGFLVSEGAAALVLSTPEFARAYGLTARGEVAGFAHTSDAQHYVAPHEPTITRCIELALADAGIGPRDVQAINAHAASTAAGDLTEAKAIRSVFGDDPPPVSANKSMTGHAMGASSAIEAVFALLGMAEGALLPTINHRADPEIDLDCVPEGTRAVPQEHVLHNAFGFGGCNCCIVLRRSA